MVRSAEGEGGKTSGPLTFASKTTPFVDASKNVFTGPFRLEQKVLSQFELQELS